MTDTMRLLVLLPTEVAVDEPVLKVVAEADTGFFGLLPRHIDFVTTLVPSLLSFVAADGREVFMAVDAGVLVKCGSEVRVSTHDAISGPELGALKARIADEFETLDEREKKARSALAKLEADFVRQFLRMKEHG